MLKLFRRLFSKKTNLKKTPYEPRYMDRVRVIGGFYRGQEAVVVDVSGSTLFVIINSSVQTLNVRDVELK